MKWPRARVWKWSAKAALTVAPPIAPRIGAACAATFSLTTTPKRAATCEISRATIGADWALRPSLATKRALSLTDLGERGANREIAALERRLLAGLAAEREHFDAGESGAGGAQILPFLARDLGDRAQKDGRRDRQFDRKRRQTERAANRAGRGGGELVGAVGRLGRSLDIEGPQRHPQRTAQRGLARVRDRPAGRLRHGAAQQLDRPPDDVGQALGEARSFQTGDRSPQICGLLAR